MSDYFRMSVITAVLKIEDGMLNHSCSASQFCSLAQGPLGRSGLNYSLGLELLLKFGPNGISDVSADPAARLRRIIETLIFFDPPPWRIAAPYGLNRMLRSMPDDHKQTLASVGLLSETASVAAFWDRVASEERRALDDALLKLGREGEKLTLGYEEVRLADAGREDLKPEWISINDNTAGYDVRSWRVEFDSVRPLLIEVKASSTRYAVVHLTRNEWSKAMQNKDAWRMHIWHIDSARPRLVEWQYSQVADHVPLEQGRGRWEKLAISVEVPASAA